MKKREFLKTTGLVALGTVVSPFILGSCANNSKGTETNPQSTAFELPALEYPFDALVPHIDAQTMEIHHGKHHAGYVNKLNTALEGHEWKGKSLEELLAAVGDNDKDTAIRNNAGGHYNHSLFWKTLGPNAGGEPTAKLLEAINTQFGSYENFVTAFKEKAATLFGSGWAWLCVGADKKLFITATPNQDNPLMQNISTEKGTPILGLDVWEHAYYLHYQNRRKEYIDSFFKLIRWDRVSENYKSCIG